MKKYVVAGNYQEYKSHIDEKGYLKSEYVYVNSPDQLRGLDKIEGFYIGSYEQRPDIEEIRQQIQLIKFKGKLSQSIPPPHPPLIFTAPPGFTPIQTTGWTPKTVMIKGLNGQWITHNIEDGKTTYELTFSRTTR